MVISKLVEGNYPNYRQVIPGETKERIALPREELLAALRRAQDHDQRQGQLGEIRHQPQ